MTTTAYKVVLASVEDDVDALEDDVVLVLDEVCDDVVLFDEVFVVLFDGLRLPELLPLVFVEPPEVFVEPPLPPADLYNATIDLLVWIFV